MQLGLMWSLALFVQYVRSNRKCFIFVLLTVSSEVEIIAIKFYCNFCFCNAWTDLQKKMLRSICMMIQVHLNHIHLAHEQYLWNMCRSNASGYKVSMHDEYLILDKYRLMERALKSVVYLKLAIIRVRFQQLSICSLLLDPQNAFLSWILLKKIAIIFEIRLCNNTIWLNLSAYEIYFIKFNIQSCGVEFFNSLCHIVSSLRDNNISLLHDEN